MKWSRWQKVELELYSNLDNKQLEDLIEYILNEQMGGDIELSALPVVVSESELDPKDKE